MDAGGRTQIDDIIRRQDGLLVMLDNDHRIAEVAQPAQAFQQAGIVALVQADRWLVEDIEHPGKAGTDLAGEANALALAARQRARCPVKREIVQPDIDEEFQTLADFLEDAFGDLLLFRRQCGLDRAEPVAGKTDREF